MAGKAPEAFRTISEVSEILDTPPHVLRFWESKFTQLRPVKRAGGRRYYRPADLALLAGIRQLLHVDGMTIRGVQKLLREKGVRHVATLVDVPEGTVTGLLLEGSAREPETDAAPGAAEDFPAAAEPQPADAASTPSDDQTLTVPETPGPEGTEHKLTPEPTAAEETPAPEPAQEQADLFAPTAAPQAAPAQEPEPAAVAEAEARPRQDRPDDAVEPAAAQGTEPAPEAAVAPPDAKEESVPPVSTHDPPPPPETAPPRRLATRLRDANLPQDDAGEAGRQRRAALRAMALRLQQLHQRMRAADLPGGGAAPPTDDPRDIP